jgi:hypothetical protein
MEGGEKPHTDKYKEIMNDWNYGTAVRLHNFQLGMKKISST